MNNDAVNANGNRVSAPLTTENHSHLVRWRSYSVGELAQIDQFLTEQGDLALQVAVWLGAEAGLRPSEIANLTVNDIDLNGNMVLVRGRGRSRNSFFAEQTEKYLRRWLLQRNSNCGHEFLLHNRYDRPLTPHVLSVRFSNAARGAGIANGTFRHLRYTMVVNLTCGGMDKDTLMAVGGWRTRSSEFGFVRHKPTRPTSTMMVIPKTRPVDW